VASVWKEFKEQCENDAGFLDLHTHTKKKENKDFSGYLQLLAGESSEGTLL